jgi:hypothetical protein
MTPNTAEVEGTCQQRVQHAFVPETGKKKTKMKTKSTERQRGHSQIKGLTKSHFRVGQ